MEPAVARGGDAMALLTEWNEIRALDPARIRQLLRTPVVVDLRNVYSPADMIAAGIDYSSIGRPTTARGAGAD
ncbi:MAG: UDP binding domain-containing protein [Alphaproteobacteria bacterium]